MKSIFGTTCAILLGITAFATWQMNARQVEAKEKQTSAEASKTKINEIKRQADADFNAREDSVKNAPTAKIRAERIKQRDAHYKAIAIADTAFNECGGLQVTASTANQIKNCIDGKLKETQYSELMAYADQAIKK